MLGDRGRGRISRRRISIGALLAAVLCPACKPPTTTTSPNATSSGDPTSTDAGSTGDANPASTKPASAKPQCSDAATLWDGNPAGCLYEHAGCCYPDPATLCAAAGCTDETCTILESRPAQARCP